MLRCRAPILMLWAALLAPTASAAQLIPLTGFRQGQVMEFRLEGIPGSTHPFDPDKIAVDVQVRTPSGVDCMVPGFWYQAFSRSLRDQQEALAPEGAGEWRARWFAEEAGAHQLTLRISTNQSPSQSFQTLRLDAAPATNAPPSFAQVANNRRYFETRAGEPLPLVGADACWHGSRGTYDYDDWFPSMAASGWNWTRIWMAPWAFGIEAGPDERLNYRLDRAWQLDRVFQLAEKHGLRLLLCLDYHGMFETQPDVWGGNNFWTRHPYNQTNGGPCANPREFFTSDEARHLYQKRLRYLVARYGASPSLFAWEFFNEIDNVYRYLNPAEVARWHQEVGVWLKAADPWKHLVSTSLTGGSDRPEIWSLSALDFVSYHSYNESSPAQRLAQVTASLRQRFGKPMIIAEAGVDWRGWARDSDPALRGFRQLLWGGVMAGSAGTSMSWWWESLHSQNVYPYYLALTRVLSNSGWGQGVWEPAAIRENPPAPATVADPIPGGTPFVVQLVMDGGWGTKPSGLLAVAEPQSAGEAPKRLNAFVHGSAHPDLRVPFKLDGWFGAGARLVLHVNSVSSGAILAIRAGGTEIFRRPLPDKDGSFNVNNEYNEDIPVDIPAGHQTLEIRNAGGDWFYLDWVRLEGVLPSRYAGDWTPAPAVTGIQQGTNLLLYAVAPGVEYPSQATATHLPVVTNLSVTVSNLPTGHYAALWFSTSTGAVVDQNAVEVAAHQILRLQLPPIQEDLVAHVFPRPRLRAEGFDAQGAFHFRAEGARLDAFRLEASGDLELWNAAGRMTSRNPSAAEFLDSEAVMPSRRFYQLRSHP